eukprot:3330336-Prymnesium_polylepis.1
MPLPPPRAAAPPLTPPRAAAHSAAPRRRAPGGEGGARAAGSARLHGAGDADRPDVQAAAALPARGGGPQGRQDADRADDAGVPLRRGGAGVPAGADGEEAGRRGGGGGGVMAPQGLQTAETSSGECATRERVLGFGPGPAVS